MSATNRGGQRADLDFYATPPALAELVCRVIRDEWMPKVDPFVLEPGSGDGSFLRAAEKAWPEATVFGVEAGADRVVQTNHAGLEAMGDNVFNPELWTDPETREASRFPVIIGNPPFRWADGFVRFCHGLLAPGGVLVFLLRLNYLGGQDRYRDLWRELPPTHVYVLPRRPGFTQDGKTDSTEYMVAVWKQGHEGPTTLGFLDNTTTLSKWIPRPEVGLGAFA